MKKFIYILLPLLVGAQSLAHAAYTYKNGKLMKSEEFATLSVQEHYSLAMDALEQENWEELVHQSVIVVKNFSSSPFAQEAYYYLGVGYFHSEEFEFANRFFTTYLKKQSTPKFFEEAIQYKFKIADRYHRGAKRHLLGWEALPKWIPAREEAIDIYDEVITALPHHPLAAQALFGKAQLLLKENEYKASIETYQILIRRFPKHPLASESYIGIAQVYLVQSQQEYPDQDFLDLAEINLRKFRADLPGEERVGVAEKMLGEMREVYASDLYDTARFYERTSKPHAAHLYYTRIMAKYPETKVAQLANKRMDRLAYKPEPAAPPVLKEQSAPQLQPPLPKQAPSILNLPVQSGHVVDNGDQPSTMQEDVK